MSGTLWFTTLGIIYLVLLLTLAVLSFRKGHWVLGLIGFVFPVLWISGPSCPAGAVGEEPGRGRYRERPHLTRWSLTQDG